jgi:acyl dehydratase
MGRRLVYGGHTIGLATHQAAKAMPGICAVVAWEKCDHTGPVYEDDLLTSSIQVDRLVPLLPTGAIATLRSIVRAERAEGCFDVLDWRYAVVLA